MKSVFRNRIFAAVSAATLSLGTFSCQNDLLNVRPTAILDGTQAFDTPSRVLAQVNGIYSYVKTGSFLGGRFQVYGDIRANDFINRTSNTVTGLGVWNHTLTETSQNDVVNTWSAAYQAINQVNVFLAGLDANASKFGANPFPSGYEATVTNYRAEVRLLRALCYYSLLQLYARPYADGGGTRPGLPLRLQAESGLGNNDLARSTVGQVYDQILLDLNYAETNLPANQGSAAQNVIRAHRNTAIALKTRVYLTMGRYADVVTEANKLVPTAAPYTAPVTSGSVANGLNSSITTVFAAPQETTESILSFPFTAQDTPGTQNQLAFYFLPASLNVGANGEYYLNAGAGGLLANSAFATTDIRRSSFVLLAGGLNYLTKYPTGTPFTDKAPVIRYSEVMLSLAEALVRGNNTVDTRALALLNAVRTRSNGTAYTAAALTPASIVDAILLERRIEFLGEGIRNIDIMRLNATIPGKGTISEVPNTSPAYVWPIPSTELANNALMTRN